MSKLILYTSYLSPASRAVLLTSKAIGLDMELRDVDITKRGHLKSEFVKLNPQHTVPVLDDNGTILWDSHAINCYLVGKYAKNDTLYPKDLKKRAIIDQRLHFDSGVLFPQLRSIFVPFMQENRTELNEDQRDRAKEGYEFLDKFLENQKWLTAGDNYTLADISCASTVGQLSIFFPFDKYWNVARWMKSCENEFPDYVNINLVIKKITPGLRAKFQSHL